ncbi:MAG: excinuclease ABC subunit UvrC [Bacteroidetes bacterium]|nr:excinuclease ABC subunit UvrC [Bacteroidota bacterium]
MDNALKNILNNLPEQPGVYKYFDDAETIIYVGKAKNLKKRVNSYFTKNHDNRKTAILVSKIKQIQYTVVDTEYDALLLENSLIKQFQPKYNISLKDDKSYPLIKITKERFPKIFPIRNPIKDGSEYFGPYSNVKLMHLILDLAKKLYPTRNCNYDSSIKNIENHKFRVCLEYQIGNCKGACENHESETDYNQSISNIKNILRGNLSEVKQHLKSKLLDAVEKLEFEEAQIYKEKLDSLEKYQAKSTIVNNKINNVDVFGLISSPQAAYINYLRVANGMIIQTHNFEYKKKIEETDEDLILSAIAEVKNTYLGESAEIIVPFIIDLDSNLQITVPTMGDKKKLLDLSMKNALYLKMEKQQAADKVDPTQKVDRILQTMMSDLRLTTPPQHIECFDNSNIQGTNPVSACVVFKDAKPSKQDYRHFNVKTVIGPDDFATMYEVITRRYSRLLSENTPLPNLIVVDGGKGQLSSAVKALKAMGIYGKVPIIGIAKRLEELFYPEDPIPLYIDKKSETLKVIQQMRDEAHRFGITHHRNRRSKNFIVTSLEDIEGVGSKTAHLLLGHFKSVKKIKEASIEDLKQVVSEKMGLTIIKYFADVE